MHWEEESVWLPWPSIGIVQFYHTLYFDRHIIGRRGLTGPIKYPLCKKSTCYLHSDYGPVLSPFWKVGATKQVQVGDNLVSVWPSGWDQRGPMISYVVSNGCKVGINLFLKPKIPLLGLLAIKAFWTLETILLCVFSYLHVSTPFLFVHTEPRVFISVPMKS